MEESEKIEVKKDVVYTYEVNKDEIKQELIFLIYKYISKIGLKSTREVLSKEIIEKNLLPMRENLDGILIKNSIDDMMSEYSHVSGDKLLDSIIESINELRTHPSGKYKGLTSFLSTLYPSSNRENKINLLKGSQDIITSVIRRSYGFERDRNCCDLQENILRELKLQKKTLGHLSATYCIIFDRTGESIITGSDDKLIKIWNTQTGFLLITLRGHTQEVCDLSLNADNTLLASGSKDKTVRIWSTKNGAELYVLNRHTGPVTSVKFAPFSTFDKKYLISTGEDACLCIWIEQDDGTFSNDGVKIFNEKIKNNTRLICSAFSPGGTLLAVGSSDAHIYLYNLVGEVNKVADLDSHDDAVDTLEFSHKGEKLLSLSKDGISRVWSLRKTGWSSISLSLNLNNNLSDDGWPKKKILLACWSLNDDFILGSLKDFYILVWSSYTGDVIFYSLKHMGFVYCIEIHPILQYIFITAGHDGLIIIWNLKTFDYITSLQDTPSDNNTRIESIIDCKMSPEGTKIVVTDNVGHIYIYGIGSSYLYQLMPYHLFFNTDYKPIIFQEGSTYDEQTGLLPHLMYPPFLVNSDGEPQHNKYQSFHLGRVNIFIQNYNLDKSKTKDEELKNCQPSNSFYSLSRDDIVRWKERTIVRQFSKYEIDCLNDNIEEKKEKEIAFYKEIQSNIGEKEINIDERQRKLMLLQSKAVQDRFKRQGVVKSEELNQLIPDLTPSHTSTESSSTYTGADEDSEISDTDYFSEYISEDDSQQNQICTRGNKYSLRKKFHIQSHIENNTSSDEESQFNTKQSLNASFFNISKNWFNHDTPCISPYVPQCGDIIVYLTQGHKLYVQNVNKNKLFKINQDKLCYNQKSFHYIEVCKVNNVSFTSVYPYFCTVHLTKMDISATYSTGINFTIRYTDLSNVDEFLILKRDFDQSLSRYKWKVGDKFKSYIDRNWWPGTIIDITPFDPACPESHFRSICIKWNTGEVDRVSPWDIFPHDTHESQLEYILDTNEWAPETYSEYKLRISNGIEALTQLSVCIEIDRIFYTVDTEQNKIAYLTSFSKIEKKFRSNYYRHKASLIWELQILLDNLKNIHIPNQKHLLYCGTQIINSFITCIQNSSYNVARFIDYNKAILNNFCADANNNGVICNSTFKTNNYQVICDEFKWLLEASELIDHLNSFPAATDLSFVKTNNYLVGSTNNMIDLLTIRRNLTSGYYLTPDSFVYDMKSLFSSVEKDRTNRRTNKNKSIRHLNELFISKIKELLPTWRKQVLSSKTRITRGRVNLFLQNIDSKTNSPTDTSPIKKVSMPTHKNENIPELNVSMMNMGQDDTINKEIKLTGSRKRKKILSESPEGDRRVVIKKKKLKQRIKKNCEPSILFSSSISSIHSIESFDDDNRCIRYSLRSKKNEIKSEYKTKLRKKKGLPYMGSY